MEAEKARRVSYSKEVRVFKSTEEGLDVYRRELVAFVRYSRSGSLVRKKKSGKVVKLKPGSPRWRKSERLVNRVKAMQEVLGLTRKEIAAVADEAMKIVYKTEDTSVL